MTVFGAGLQVEEGGRVISDWFASHRHLLCGSRNILDRASVQNLLKIIRTRSGSLAALVLG